jgi:hypothetical protein
MIARAITGAVDQLLTSIFVDVYRPRPKGGSLEWVSKNCYIPAEVSPDHPGFYSLAPSPLCDIIFDWYDSPEWDELILPKGSQYGASQAAHCVSVFDAYWKGRNIALLLDSREEAKRVNQTRLKPLLNHCAAMASKISENADDLSNLTLYLRGLTYFLMGSFSPSALANKTIGFGISDECDNYPESPKGESNALDMLRDRLKKINGAKLLAFSKPKDETTLIWPEYLTGSRHKCFVPCPRCETFQELVKEQVEISHCRDLTGAFDLAAIERDAFYRCAACGGVIEEKEKPAMIAERRWKATNGKVDFEGKDKYFVDLPKDSFPPAPRKMSAHVSDLYCLTPKDTWGRIMAEWIDAQGSISKMKRVKRGRFALPWSEGALKIEKSDLDLMLGGYQRGQLPAEPDIVLIASDVQKDVKKWVKAGFKLDGTCWVIDWGECLGFNQLVVEADVPVVVLRWGDDVPESERVSMIARKGLIDEGGGDGKENDNQGPVRDFVISTFLGLVRGEDGSEAPDFRFFSCYGRGGLAVKNWKDAFDVRTINHKGWSTVVYKFNDDLFKRELYEQRIANYRAYVDAKRRGAQGAELPIRLFFPISRPGEADGVSWDQFKSELSQERREFDSVRRRYVWREPSDANDFGDALKMLFVGFYVMLPALTREVMIRKARRDRILEKLKRSDSQGDHSQGDHDEDEGEDEDAV